VYVRGCLLYSTTSSWHNICPYFPIKIDIYVGTYGYDGKYVEDSTSIISMHISQKERHNIILTRDSS
jgi:hypothetical protein